MFFTFAAAIGGLAQLVRALAWHARGREFESRILHHFLRVIVVFSGGYFHFNGIRFYALVKPTVLPFRRPERRSTAADVRPRTPRDPRSFSANRSSAQPTYNCRPHPLHLHLRLRIETADNLQRGAESPRSESYPKHVRSHDLPRPLPTLRAPQTTPSPDRIPPGSTALPQTVRGRSATIPPRSRHIPGPSAFTRFPHRSYLGFRRETNPSPPSQNRFAPAARGISSPAANRCASQVLRDAGFRIRFCKPTDRWHETRRPAAFSSFLFPSDEISRKSGYFETRSPHMPPEPPRNRSHQRPSIRKRPPAGTVSSGALDGRSRVPDTYRESDRPAAERTDFAGTAVIRAPDRPGPVAELVRSIPATFRDRTEAYSHPSSPAPPAEPFTRAGHRTTHLRKTSAGTDPKTVHQSRFTRQPRAGPEKPPEEPVPRAGHSPPQKSSPAPPAEPTKQIRNESVEHAASVQTKCVQAKGNAQKGNAQKEMRKAKRNTQKREATPQNASFRPAICRPETSANAAPGS